MTEELRYIIATNPKGRIMINLSDEDACFTAITYKEFQLALERGDEQIITPLTTAIDNYYCCLGYRVNSDSTPRSPIIFSSLGFGITRIQIR